MNPENNNPEENKTVIGTLQGSYSSAPSTDPRVHKRFKVLTLLTVVINGGSVLFLLALGIFGQLTHASGLEFVGLLFVPIIFLGYALAIFYIFYYPYYVLKYKQRNRYVALGAVVLVVSIALIVLQFYSSERQKTERAEANRILTLSEVEALVEGCRVKSVDEGSKRVQGIRGDVTYIKLFREINGQSVDDEKYADLKHFDAIVAKVNEESSRCGKVDVYTREDLKASRYP